MLSVNGRNRVELLLVRSTNAVLSRENYLPRHCVYSWLTVVCETKWDETKWNETKWKSVVCEMKICSLRNENL